MFNDDSNIRNVAKTYRQMQEATVPKGKTAILSHSDEVSGTTVFANGTKVYWTEGRSSNVVVRHPNGTLESFHSGGIRATSFQQAILDKENEIEENGADVRRDMTPAEEKEWEQARLTDR